MAGVIRMSFQEVRGTANQFRTKGEEINGIIGQLAQEVNKLRGSWEGEASTAFESEFSSLKPSMEKFVQLCTQISEQLNSAAQLIEEQDKAIASKMRAN